MSRTYQLLRYVPDPVRGEVVNAAVVGLDGEAAFVLTLPESDFLRRSQRVAPHIDARLAWRRLDEMRQLRTRSDVTITLRVFDPTFKLEPPLALAVHGQFLEMLGAVFEHLVAVPRSRPQALSVAYRDVRGAVEHLTHRLSAFGSIAKRGLAFDDFRRVSGLPNEPLPTNAQLPEAFDAVLPNCTRVVAFQGLLVGPRVAVETFFQKKEQIHSAREFFSTRGEKAIISGALMLPSPLAAAAPQTRRGMREDLETVASEILVGGRKRPAVFDLADPLDERELEQLSIELASAVTHMSP